MKKRFLTILPFGFLLLSCGHGGNSVLSKTVSSPVSYYSGTYQNGTFPLRSSGTEFKGEVADPSTPRKSEKDGYYYIYTTDRRCFRSEDLCVWELISENFIDVPSWTHTGKSCYLWAPDVVKIGDTWILYYAVHDTENGTYYDSIGYATAEDAGGPWTDQGKLVEGTDIDNASCIDPAVYVEEDGTVYMSLGSFSGIDLIELEADGMSVKGSFALQKTTKTRITFGSCEGSYITKKGGFYYLWLSLGSCCSGKDSTYRVMTARSKSIRGPYLDEKGLDITAQGCNNMSSLCLWARMVSDRPVYGPGHNSVFHDGAGDDWIIYHGYFQADNYLTRHLMIDKILYDAAGFPYVENKIPSYMVEKDGPRLL